MQELSNLRLLFEEQADRLNHSWEHSPTRCLWTAEPPEFEAPEKANQISLKRPRQFGMCLFVGLWDLTSAVSVVL